MLMNWCCISGYIQFVSFRFLLSFEALKNLIRNERQRLFSSVYSVELHMVLPRRPYSCIWLLKCILLIWFCCLQLQNYLDLVFLFNLWPIWQNLLLYILLSFYHLLICQWNLDIVFLHMPLQIHVTCLFPFECNQSGRISIFVVISSHLQNLNMLLSTFPCSFCCQLVQFPNLGATKRQDFQLVDRKEKVHWLVDVLALKRNWCSTREEFIISTYKYL